MMKKIFIVLAVLLLAGSAYADVSVEGKYRLGGDYDNNLAFADDDEVVNGYWEQSLDLMTKFTADENTSVTALWQIHGTEEDGEMMDSDGVSAEDNDNISENIRCEQLFMTHKFGNGITLQGGLMPWNNFGTAFGDNEEGWYRFNASMEVGNGTLDVDYIKFDEVGADLGVEDAEKDDDEGLAVTYATEVGGMNLQGRLQYNIYSSAIMDYGNDGVTEIIADVAVNGEAGAIAYEAEVIIDQVSTDEDGLDNDDAMVFGIYGDVSANINDQTKVGGWLAYLSVDDGPYDGTEVSMDIGDDMDRTEIFMEDGASGYEELAGCTVLGAYCDIAVNDDLTVSPSLVYWMSNWEDDDTTGYELNVIGTVNLSQAVTYKAGFAYADIDLDYGGGEPDTGAAMKIFHEIAVDL